jgi:predicted ester cyclase
MDRMKGFDPKFTDFPDFIQKITREIWEDRGIGTLNHYYTPDIPMRFPEGVSIGNQSTMNGTLATLAEFPDRELTGEDVIWSGNEEDGFLSSHRLLTMGTHTGGGYFGPPTGKRFVIRAIADCAAINEQINDEWLIRDTAGIVKQLGMKPKKFARNLIAREGGPENCVKPFSPAVDVDGPYKSRGNDNEWGARLADILTRMMDKDFAVIRAEYDRAVQTEHPAATTVHSWADTEAQWMGLRASFPNAEFAIEHRIGREDPMLPPRAAIRWSLHGKHDGWGMFGQPTGAEVYVMGFTHAEFGPYGLRREWTLFDHVSIWKQILMQTGEV